MKPLLIGNTVPYKGSWVPLNGLDGMVRVEGLGPYEDGGRVIIHTSTLRAYLVKKDSVVNVAAMRKPVRIRAERVDETGKEVAVWVS